MNERLGFKSTDRLLIIHADDFGMSSSANEAASFCKDNLQADVGIQLTLTCSENYRYIFKVQMIHKIKLITAATTQITIHPAIITEELKTITAHYEKQEMEYRLFNDPDIKDLLEQEDIKTISWKQICDL